MVNTSYRDKQGEKADHIQTRITADRFALLHFKKIEEKGQIKFSTLIYIENTKTQNDKS